MQIMRKELLTEPSLVSGVSIREEVAQMSRILLGIHEGKENSGRRIHMPKELEGVVEKGAVRRDMEVSRMVGIYGAGVTVWQEMELKSQESQLEPGQTHVYKPLCINVT